MLSVFLLFAVSFCLQQKGYLATIRAKRLALGALVVFNLKKEAKNVKSLSLLESK